MKPKLKKSIKAIARLSNLENRQSFLRLDKNECLDKKISSYISRSFMTNLKETPISMYPEVGELKKKIADYTNLVPEQVILGDGSDALIRQVFTVFARPRSTIVLPIPTYAMYEIYTKLFDCKLRPIACEDDFSHNPAKIIKALSPEVSIVAIANPNSPTGREIKRSYLIDILKCCEQLGILLLIDEAYYYFSKTTLLPEINQSENLAVIRTFSKAFGLAGCRIGFLAANQALVANIQKARPMYELNALSAVAASTALDNKVLAKEYASTVNMAKSFLREKLKPLGWKVFPSNTNFVNIRLPKHIDAGKFEDFAREKGILLKGRLGKEAFKNCIRITVGPIDIMKPLVSLVNIFSEENA